jgi:putative transposase
MTHSNIIQLKQCQNTHRTQVDDRLCLLVIIGSDETGRKELIALADGYRQSAASWEEVLTDLRQRGLTTAPKLAVGDGALGFWKAVAKLWPQTDPQRCWVHKTANVLEVKFVDGIKQTGDQKQDAA